MREPFMSGKSFVSGFYEKHHGRVLTTDGHVNGTGYFGKYDAKDYSLHCGQGGQGESNQQNSNKVVDEFVHVGNGSDPLAASLYVPRNDKLVEIDGNLIIRSVLASEKAMASHGSANKKYREPGLTVPGDLAPPILGIHPRLYRSPAVREWVLGSEEKENVKATMQQWYLEGVVGPLLSSNMCTEVFKFDASSSALQSIVSITNARYISMKERNESLSSLVVYVLVDGDGDGIMGLNYLDHDHSEQLKNNIVETSHVAYVSQVLKLYLSLLLDGGNV
ncbi:hypothetical protein MTR67_018934 [Solanum verrucosum]|uniref:Uncharacterized protein n=1 Tax=Solanum verrucosum TaxID=315347 RepID=A0AAF0QTA0_SOLVR|nr:hypothetical protein MTR67_018934 [Solanum verrucosum]